MKLKRRSKTRSGFDGMRGEMRAGLLVMSFFTFAIDALLLVQPVYMLQVYDRVLASGSTETLAFISIVAVVVLVLLGALDTIRTMIASRVAARMEVEAGSPALVASMHGPKAVLGDVQPLRDLSTVRSFIGNRGAVAFLDLPFAPLFIGILYLIHPHLFWLTAAGAVVLAGIAILNQTLNSQLGADAGEGSMSAMLAAQSFTRGAESIRAMGMVANVILAWGHHEALSLDHQDRAARLNAVFAGLSRTMRLGLQIAILGYGSYLVLDSQMTAGMIFASSLISGRGLQPIDQVIGGWKGFVEARRAWVRLKAALSTVAPLSSPMKLPKPEGRLAFEQVVVMPPGSVASNPLLKRVSFRLQAGECCAVIGPSGAGKSTLARAVVGAVRPRQGIVRIDGADIQTWSPDELGSHLGYLSQEVDLLPGTVAQNIARFAPAAASADIVAAARKAQVHELVLGLSKGYDTVIGPGGQQLSGGQRQRIGLARAFFGEPKLLVLDEPNANLDADGDMALDRALVEAKADGVTVLVVTQRRPLAERADKILMLRDGAVEDFGPRMEVFGRQAQRFQSSRGARMPGADSDAVRQAPAPSRVSAFPTGRPPTGRDTP